MKHNLSPKHRIAMSAKSIVIPAVIVIMLMHVLLVYNTIRLNRVGQRVSQATQNNFVAAGMANAFSAATDQQSELATGFVTSGDEALIPQYIEASGEAMNTADALSGMLTENGFAQADTQFHEALSVYYGRREIELTAIRLRALSQDVDLSAYPALGQDALPDDLAALPGEAMQGSAREMILGSDYQSARGGIQRNVSKAIGAVGDESSAAIRNMSVQMGRYRIMQYVMMAVVILTLMLMCILLFTNLLNPLEKCVEIVQRGESVPNDQGFSELRRLAGCYDDLLAHRNRLEADLRHQSLTDALTGLPNRLAFQNALEALDGSNYRSLTVFSLDVNGLKAANDRLGHGEGDKLLCSTAECIRQVFAGEDGMSVFRFGGDEFAALWKDRGANDIARALETFEKAQAACGISVSVGWAHADQNVGSDVGDLFEQADKAMYREKTRMHSRRAGDTRTRAEDLEGAAPQAGA